MIIPGMSRTMAADAGYRVTLRVGQVRMLRVWRWGVVMVERIYTCHGARSIQANVVDRQLCHQSCVTPTTE